MCSTWTASNHHHVGAVGASRGVVATRLQQGGAMGGGIVDGTQRTQHLRWTCGVERPTDKVLRLTFFGASLAAVQFQWHACR